MTQKYETSQKVADKIIAMRRSGVSVKDIAFIVEMSRSALYRLYSKEMSVQPIQNVPRKGSSEYVPDKGLEQKIAKMKTAGFTIQEISETFNMCYRTMMKHYSNAIVDGEREMVSNVADKLYRTALDGNITAMIFYLKARGGWSESPKQILDTEQYGVLKVENLSYKPDWASTAEIENQEEDPERGADEVDPVQGTDNDSCVVSAPRS